MRRAEHRRTDAFEVWSLGQQGDQTSQAERKSVLNIHWKAWCWSSSILATWCKEPTHLKRPWCWERLKAGGEGGERGWHVWMLIWWIWELDCKESWAPQNCCFWTVVLEKIESPLDCKEIQPVHPKGNQSWIIIGGTDAEAEAPILWPPDTKNPLIRKDPDAGKGWRHEKGTTEKEMVGWHHQLNGHEFEQALGVGDGQERLACYSPWDCKQQDMTEQLN